MSNLKYTLVTGGLGFIGLNYIKKKHLSNNIINIDCKNYAANNISIKSRSKYKYIFIKDNIGNKKKIEQVFNKYKINSIINFAAETHVDNSIFNPEKVINNNIKNFTKFVIQFKKFYLEKKIPKNFKFINISTDEVYGSLKLKEKSFKEGSVYNPRNPYSASKAAIDHICSSLYSTFNLPIITIHLSNNFGCYQHDEKLIPTIIRNAIRGKKIPIYGKGTNIRDWMYVEDTYYAIEKVLKTGKIGQTYNFGGGEEFSNIIIAKKICKILNKKIFNKKHDYEKLISFVKDRKGHDFRYSLSNSKVKKIFSWSPSNNFDNNLKTVVEWYIKKYNKKNA